MILTPKIVDSLKNPGETTKNWFPKLQKIDFFPNRFFDVLVVAKRRSRLEFWQRVALDFLDVPGRSNDEQNRFLSRNFRENIEKFPQKIQKLSRSIVYNEMKSTEKIKLEGADLAVRRLPVRPLRWSWGLHVVKWSGAQQAKDDDI